MGLSKKITLVEFFYSVLEGKSKPGRQKNTLGILSLDSLQIPEESSSRKSGVEMSSRII